MVTMLKRLVPLFLVMLFTLSCSLPNSGRTAEDQTAELQATVVALQTALAQAQSAAQQTEPALPPDSSATPAPAIPADTSASAILEAGQSWRQGGMELRLQDVELVTSGVVLTLNLTNRKDQRIALRYNMGDSLKAEDNLGHTLTIGCSSGPQFGYMDPQFETYETTLDPGASTTLQLCSYSGTLGQDWAWILADVADPAVTEITVTVSGISSITESHWRIPIAH